MRALLECSSDKLMRTKSRVDHHRSQPACAGPRSGCRGPGSCAESPAWPLMSDESGRMVMRTDHLRRSLLCIGQFDCPNCQKAIRYPLKPMTRVFYWAILLSVPTLILIGPFLHVFALPGLGWLVVAVVLAMDQSLRTKVRNAWLQHERQGSPRC
jgi:hypothetical protein